ncbi:hypothetical protein JOE48_004447 [Methylobacterium sp. PvR107]|nr:hypothetical protein [Methylobacterium sp. PvR107]
MTDHADRSSPKDDNAPAGGASASGSGTSGNQAGSKRENRGGPKGQANPELREAIDRATAAVGQDDGKR